MPQLLTLPSHPPRTLQADINEKMRAILVDWLVEVHLKFKVRAWIAPSPCSLLHTQLRPCACSLYAHMQALAAEL